MPELIKRLLPVLAVAALAVCAAPATADQLPGAGEPTAEDKAFAALLAKEKEARKACKIEVCSIFRSKKAAGKDVACHIDKSFSAKDLSEMIKKTQVSWPWGNVTCSIEVNVKRAAIVAAMTEPKNEFAFDEHEIVCQIARETAGEAYEIKMKLKPKISFEAGKAVKAEIGWGSLTAPLVVKSVVWPATGFDNQVNVLGGTVMDAMNEFIGPKCDEIKDLLTTD